MTDASNSTRLPNQATCLSRSHERVGPDQRNEGKPAAKRDSGKHDSGKRKPGKRKPK